MAVPSPKIPPCKGAWSLDPSRGRWPFAGCGLSRSSLMNLTPFGVCQMSYCYSRQFSGYWEGSTLGWVFVSWGPWVFVVSLEVVVLFPCNWILVYFVPTEEEEKEDGDVPEVCELHIGGHACYWSSSMLRDHPLRIHLYLLIVDPFPWRPIRN